MEFLSKKVYLVNKCDLTAFDKLSFVWQTEPRWRRIFYSCLCVITVVTAKRQYLCLLPQTGKNGRMWGGQSGFVITYGLACTTQRDAIYLHPISGLKPQGERTILSCTQYECSKMEWSQNEQKTSLHNKEESTIGNRRILQYFNNVLQGFVHILTFTTRFSHWFYTRTCIN